MTDPPPYRVPARLFSALARGGGGPEAVRLIAAARRSRTLLLVRMLVKEAGERDHPQVVIAQEAYRALARVQRIAPRAVDRVLAYPSVGAWAIRTVLLLRRGAVTAARPEDLACVAAAAAVRGAAPITIRFAPDGCAPDESRRVLSLPSLGCALVSGGHRGVLLCCDRDGARLTADGACVTIPKDPHSDGAGWRGLCRITVGCDGLGADFLLDGWAAADLPPEFRTAEHLCDLKQVEQWRRRIAAGWELLVRHHREVAREVAAAIGVLTPLPSPSSGQTSATLSDAFGCVFLSLPPDARWAAVTLAHELAHTKLAAVMDLFALLEPDAHERFYAPWRDDPRPLPGLLHGTYAHLAVTAFWRRQRWHEEAAAARHAHTEYARWRRAAQDTAETLLASGRLTATGRRFIGDMARTLGEWSTDPVPDEAVALAQRLAEEHRRRWRAAHTE